jgi:hypothetical protein
VKDSTIPVVTLEQLQTPAFVDALINASVWNVAPVSAVPQVKLTRWQVMLLPNGDRHFVGWDTADRQGRASTKVVEFDAATARGRTASGRVYELIGPPGNSGDAMHTWRRRMELSGAEGFIDVSAEVQAVIDAANAEKLR